MGKKWSSRPYWGECNCGNWYWKSKFDGCEACYPEQYFNRFYFQVTAEHKKLLPGFVMMNKFYLEVDHIVPKWFLKSRNISVIDGCSVDNLQLISPWDNTAMGKHSKSWLLPESWISYITEKKYDYFMNGIPYRSILDMCNTNGVPYVRIAPRFVKNWPNGFEYNGNRFAVEEQAPRQVMTSN